MKYMGSKRAMLKNGLGKVLDREIAQARRFVDLFTGSAAVATHVAESRDVEVCAFDLQEYSRVLASAVIERKAAVDADCIWECWYRNAFSELESAGAIPDTSVVDSGSVLRCRVWSSSQVGWPICQAYGGHYFSPLQSSWIDALRRTLPRSFPESDVALAALVQASSKCAASPGHTAQPFQPTRGSATYLKLAWQQDLPHWVHTYLKEVSCRCAKTKGRAAVADAHEVAPTLEPTDLVFIDPPYSGVHYSRFYHVLESIALGAAGDVSGTGRYPPADRRPRSRYSLKTESADALEDLISDLADCGVKAIVTFPDHDCSNGLSGEGVRDICRSYFKTREKIVDSRFSTLGGTKQPQGSTRRGGRQYRRELILTLNPR